MNNTLILCKNNLVSIPEGKGSLGTIQLGTILSNLRYYGYAPSVEALKALMKLSEEQATSLWKDLDKTLKEVTGENRNIAKFVVYKNFPEEVLSMSKAEYWFNQICMYIGFPNELFTQEEKERPKLDENLSLKILHLAKDNSLQNILDELLKLPCRWTEEQQKTVEHLSFKSKLSTDINSVVFKENMVWLAKKMMQVGINVVLKSATDILRLAVAMSSGDISLRTNSRFKKFTRKERKSLLFALENSSSLEEDVAKQKNRFKKLFKALHPGDYSVPRVQAVYNEVYNDRLRTFDSYTECGIANVEESTLGHLSTRPGIYMRRLYNLIRVFGKNAVDVFEKDVANKLTVSQLLKLFKHSVSFPSRKFRTFPPKGNWNKLQVVENKQSVGFLQNLCSVLQRTLKQKLKNVKVSCLDEKTKFVKLQTNNSELSSFGPGTIFEIPENIKFIRSASYWEYKCLYGNVWYDNGWNFFDENWKPLGTCCWNSQVNNNHCVFSGDPTNIKQGEGKACQMIDLYLDKMRSEGIRYAVWNILCYSRRKFSEAKDVFACLQWGENEVAGKLFEPSRCQLSFPLKGDNLTKYIAYIDLQENKLVYLDANLKGNVSSALLNQNILAEKMPAVQEYIESLPSVYDLFQFARQTQNGMVVCYDDLDYSLTDGQEAYVFKKLNDKNSFNQFDITKLLNI